MYGKFYLLQCGLGVNVGVYTVYTYSIHVVLGYMAGPPQHWIQDLLLLRCLSKAAGG